VSGAPAVGGRLRRGNHASVAHALHDAGLPLPRDPRRRNAGRVPTCCCCPASARFRPRWRVHGCGLVEFLRRRQRPGQPLLGICLGMQLLADNRSNTGHRRTGPDPRAECCRWAPALAHRLEHARMCCSDDPLLEPSDGESLYFNHSYALPRAAGLHRAACWPARARRGAPRPTVGPAVPPGKEPAPPAALLLRT
jgi:imidazoleglycerol phosphate synthase glutamine amidotransferase subunit HisH